MNIQEVLHVLNRWAPPVLQESYDNAGLQVGDASALCTGILCTLDVTDEVISEAIANKCNLIISHHPVIFHGIKSLTGRDEVDKLIIRAVKEDIAIFSIHTNLDNLAYGVSSRIAQKLGLRNGRVLLPAPRTLRKLVTFVPVAQLEQVRTAIFEAGAGAIGNYSECSFGVEGTGTFLPGPGTNPFVGTIGKRQDEGEVRIESIFPLFLEAQILEALKKSHPYEEVAYDVYALENKQDFIGAGWIGTLDEALDESSFLVLLATNFAAKGVRHSPLTGREIRKVAFCGGSGSFLIASALAERADAFVTADVKYHDFFRADGKLLIADIGHYESEQYTTDLIHDHLRENFPTFAILKTRVNTNPVRYFSA